MINKVNKTIVLLRKLKSFLLRKALITIYKVVVRPQLDYGNVLYDQTFNNSFHGKLESVQYNASLTITGVIKGMSKEKIYQSLGLESLHFCIWFRKLCFLLQIFQK